MLTSVLFQSKLGAMPAADADAEPLAKSAPEAAAMANPAADSGPHAWPCPKADAFTMQDVMGMLKKSSSLPSLVMSWNLREERTFHSPYDATVKCLIKAASTLPNTVHANSRSSVYRLSADSGSDSSILRVLRPY
ncbi:hypothetical protein J6590_089108 [Homalodisca vitripennis]|nr:hypothetical protein J6590_089108 [Homalodisca vitripennis]